MAEFIDLPSITKRLREVITQSGLNAKEFAERADIAPATLSQNVNERSPINVTSINKIIATFPEEVDPYWFVFGERGEAVPRPAVDASQELPQEVEALQKILRQQAEEIAQLRTALSEKRTKEISHITVFYSDNSFSTFEEHTP